MSKPPGNLDNVDPAFDADAQALRELFSLAPAGHWSDLVPDGIVCLDWRRRILFANRAARELFAGANGIRAGESARQFPGLWNLLEELRLETLVSPETDQGFQQVVRPVSLAVGTVRLSRDAAASVSWRGARRVFTLVVRAESQTGAPQQALYQLQKRQVIGSLAGGVAHDFNNILTAVIGNLDLALSEADLTPMLRELLGQAISSARRGAELNTKLLSFSRQVDARPASVNLARLIEETVFILRRSIDPNIRIGFPPPPAGLWPAWVDEGQFMQVLMNLCLNSRDAMPKGGDLTFKLANRVFAEHEARGARHAGEFLQATVSDTGRGMTPEVLGRLFEPYFTTKEFGRGAGLGLSIANHIVVESGGWMEVESQPGRGSHFHVFLPRSRDQSPVVAASAAPKAPDSPALDGNETILLVDDEQPVRNVINAILAYRGYKVIEARDGAEALERFGASMDIIQLVLLDIRMPRMNGWDTMDGIHKMNPRMPVLLLSGGSSDPPADHKSTSRAAAVLRKPFTGAEVLRAVREVLDEAKQTGEGR